ncbi:MAG: hypothetical protein BMS9Abin14_680 [Gammaproteobacteria bacterium]|nr:MAG: hypothetical protein BMS9Abin14_680 [Gammaproteobacteria bacterium]
MKRRLKLLAVIAGVPVLFAMLAILALPVLVDSSYYRDKAIALVKARTGRDLHIDGKLRLRLLPELRWTATEVRLGNPPGYTGSNVARLAALTVDLRLLPLLSGRLEARRLSVRGLTLNLERDQEGRGNWLGLTGAEQQSNASQRSAAEASPAAVTIDQLDIRGATLNWRDASTGASSTIAEFDLQTGALGAGTGIDDVLVRVTLPGSASPRAAATIEARGDLTLTAAGAQLVVPNLIATVANLALDELRIDGTLSTRLSADFAQQRLVLDALRVSAETSGSEGARATVEIDTRLAFDFSRQRLAPSTLSLKIPAYSVSGVGGELVLSGLLDGDLGTGTYALKEVQSDGTVGGDRTPDDRLPFRFAADLKLTERERTLTAERLQLSIAGKQVNGELTLRAVQAPPGIGGTFGLRVEGQQLEGSFSVAATTAGLDLILDLAADLDIDRGSYALRGHNDIALRASVNRAPAEQRYRVADLRVNADLAEPSFAGGRLAVGLRADLDVDLKSETVRSDNLQLDVDDSRVVGSVSVRRFDSPAVRFDLQADSVDADRLLPQAPASAAVPVRATPVRATIDAIRGLDLSGEVRVQKLMLRGLQLDNVRLTSGGGVNDG